MKDKSSCFHHYFELTMHRIVVCLAFMTLFIVTSCEQRDPLAEYEVLRDSVFALPEEGVNAAQEYIDYFYKKAGARITEVDEIRQQYRKMEDFFSNPFSSFADYMNQSRDLNRELSNSNYYGVRQTWKNLYEKERNRFLGPILDSITDSDFDAFFRSQILTICENEFSIWEIESIDQMSLTPPALMSNGMAKESTGEYRIHLNGTIIGLFNPEAIITISGNIGPDETGQKNYIRTSYEFLKKPIL
ncbi:MAG: hypothetical protein IKH26_12500 [Bacteroidaceae bacterium]|nr:hypothetical protein [Bacteroidaceae bacterium]